MCAAGHFLCDLQGAMTFKCWEMQVSKTEAMAQFRLKPLELVNKYIVSTFHVALENTDGSQLSLATSRICRMFFSLVVWFPFSVPSFDYCLK